MRSDQDEKKILNKLAKYSIMSCHYATLPEVDYVTASLSAVCKFEKCNSISLDPCTSNPEKQNYIIYIVKISTNENFSGHKSHSLPKSKASTFF